MPIKDRRTKILLLLYLIGEFEFVSISENLQKIFDIYFNQKTRGALSSLVNKGLIEKEDSENVSYRITDRGLQQLCLEFPYFRFFHREWDGTWRIISYEIPESKRHLRDSLRREMRGWGLGPWHRSFWLTPHPIIPNLRELVTGKEEAQYIQAFESTHVFGDVADLVEKVWEKSRLDSLYRNLFKSWHTTLSEDRQNSEKMQDIIYAFIRIIRDDPGLPKSLVGKDWIGFEAYKLFKEIRSILMKPITT
ncbi:hypothetical protein A2690_01220 [Candidatus Roizmanbacteria bacterium RIFCSPHIGHO2_01_FULL_39_12b]|uniref:Uncharacterized protein n=1 Tax=Candidatus Roizmanbacteria bacterium RIFCSPHIGHO2_01_FULL_39_12b TaxID=1802030 RepID=A0A1F7G9C8_9BACT|nr:MAG: hypothetical protein A2690_01220 [Candidatus Roizmanbacteria bacterium RIFCSPHIGHO2_01_FULL_39_12b]OGK45985.1 MAG: hypothetical protein A3B46_00985 [Candidatus Roizmanbacteria bacterium RIFCSPLOWO2_01_FULL_39_19]